MTTHSPDAAADFDARLQQALDDRRDPLDDPQLVAWLDAHPERLAAFAALRDDLRALGDDRRAPAVRSAPVAGRRTAARSAPVARRRPAVRAVALAAAVAAAAWAVALVGDEPSPQPSPQPPAGRSPGRVLTARLDSHAPRLYAAADFAVRESLAVSPATAGVTLRFETYHLHHVPR